MSYSSTRRITKASPAFFDFWLNRISQLTLRLSLCIVAPQCSVQKWGETIGNRLTGQSLGIICLLFTLLVPSVCDCDCSWVCLPVVWSDWPTATPSWTGMCVCVLGSERDWFVGRLGWANEKWIDMTTRQNVLEWWQRLYNPTMRSVITLNSSRLPLCKYNHR